MMEGVEGKGDEAAEQAISAPMLWPTAWRIRLRRRSTAWWSNAGKCRAQLRP